MGTESVNQFLAELREKAAFMEPFSAEAATAYRDAASMLASRAAADASLSARLRIAEAAAEFGWNAEALRRRIAGDPSLNAGTDGAPLVTRATMLKLGRGRGRRPRTEAPPAPASTGEAKPARRSSASRPEAASGFAKIKAQATRSRSVAA